MNGGSSTMGMAYCIVRYWGVPSAISLTHSGDVLLRYWYWHIGTGEIQGIQTRY